MSKKKDYLRIKHGSLNKIFDRKLDLFFLNYMNSKVKPLKMGVSVGIGSHVDLIMTIFESCNNFQVTHWKACIKRNVGF